MNNSKLGIKRVLLPSAAGVGKTRLALEVARELVHDFADGVHQVSLAPLSDPALVIPTIAHRLGLTESGSQPVLELLKVSQRAKHRLLLLDNFEQVIQAAALFAGLLEACPAVKLLVTSREVRWFLSVHCTFATFLRELSESTSPLPLASKKPRIERLLGLRRRSSIPWARAG